MGPDHQALGAALDPWLAVVLLVAGLVTAVLAGLGLAVVLRRRARSYLLIAAALVVLFARTLIAGAALTGHIGEPGHHFLEHSLDVVVAALVIAAVYYARSIEPTPAVPTHDDD